MKRKTADAAVGKWFGILSHFGIDHHYLRNIHGPCPLCGGSDRFRYDNKDGKGTYYCNQCGSGDGLDLAIRFTGRDFKAITAEIDSIVGNIDTQQPRKSSNSAARIKKILAESAAMSDDGPVRRYLRARRLPVSTMLREHPSLTYFEDGEKAGDYPAMIALMCDTNGVMCGLHVTYLDSVGNKAHVSSPKKMLKALDIMPPSFVRLTKPYEVLGIAEGIETALAVMKRFNVPCWAATSAGLLERFTPPPEIKTLTIFADNDASFTGQKSAYTLANRLYEKMDVKVIVPPDIGDFAD